MSPSPDLAPHPSARARVGALAVLVLAALGLRAWLTAPQLEDPPPPPRCARWLQVGGPEAPLVCAPRGRLGRLLWAGLPQRCWSRLTREPPAPGDRLVPDARLPETCQRLRMRPGIVRTLDLAVAVNRADEGELALLPGVGPALARRIVEDRVRAGPYGRVEDLQRVRGIGPRLVARLRPRVSF